VSANVPRKPIFRRALAGAAILAALCWAGCASSYTVKVDAMRAPVPAEKKISSYQIRPANAALEPQGLRYREAVQQVKTALSASGLFEAPTSATADMIVEIDYGMEPPRMKLEEVDLQKIDGVAAAASAQAAPVRNSDGSYRADMPDGRTACDGGETEPELRPVVVCEKYMSVTGRENHAAADGRPAPELWRVHVSIEDESRDLRDYLPVLLSVAMDEIGKDTGGGQTVTLSEQDEAIRFIKRGM
jgi:hypothetical protein